MKIIKVITDKDFNLPVKKMKNSKVRLSVRAIVFSSDGKIALLNKTKKNQYKLPGGGVENGEKLEDALRREILEETGCKIDIVGEIGIIREKRSHDNFIQESTIYLAKVNDDTQKLNLTQREKDEGGRLIWKLPKDSLELIKSSFNKLKESKYESIYHSRFVAKRDQYILEYFLSKNNDIWYKLYENYINNEYRDWEQYYKIKMRLKNKFNREVIKHYDGIRPVLECGCGLGKTSIYYASLGIKTYAMDLEQAMVDKTNSLSKKYNKKNKVKCVCGNILNIPYKDKYFSVTHSSGVLEHFQDNEIKKIINEQLRVSDYMVFSVPTKYFEKKMLGNERFMSRKEWRNIIKNSNGVIIKETGYHYKNFGKRLSDIIKKPNRLFKPIAMYTFVLTERSLTIKSQ